MTAPQTQPDASSTMAAGGFVSQLFFDGLHLRAEHLQRMQDFGADLVRTTAATLGSGVHAGLGLSVSNAVLTVSPGAAIAPGGRLLRSAQPISLSLAELDPVETRYWLVVAAAASGTAGTEPVAGGICDCGCDDRTSHAATGVDGLAVRLVRADRPGLAAVRDPRATLAHELFQAEQHGPPIRLGTEPDNELKFLNRNWSAASRAAPISDEVPLGILVRGRNGVHAFGWETDEWVLRRELGEPPGPRWWEGQLGLRPRTVFLAQVLQFQALFARRADLLGLSDAAATTTLADIGLDRLPPAGFLPAGPRSRESIAQRLLGGGILGQVCTGRPDDAIAALARARHRPRITLGDSDRPAAVDIIVPEPTAADGTPDWVVFVHRDDLFCGRDDPPQGRVTASDTNTTPRKKATPRAARTTGRS